jgi:replicative DNA helicase
MVERDVQAILNELVRRANESTRRLRALEERDAVIETHVSTLEDSVLKIIEENRLLGETINEKLTNIDNNIVRINNELAKINKNMEKMAKRTELKELENMIAIFNPMKTNFVTKEDVERIVREMK